MLALALICELHHVHVNSEEVDDQPIPQPSDEELQQALKDAGQFQEIDLDNEEEASEDEPEFSVFRRERRRHKNVSLACLKRHGFANAIKALGVNKIPGVKLGTIPRTLVNYLKKYKQLTFPKPKVEVPPTRRPHYGKGPLFPNRRRPRPQDERIILQNDDEEDGEDGEAADIQKRSSEHHICADRLMIKLINANVAQSQAYAIDTRQCEKTVCQSEVFLGLAKTELGTCSVVLNTLNLFISDENRNLVPQTFTVGAACKCTSPFP